MKNRISFTIGGYHPLLSLVRQKLIERGFVLVPHSEKPDICVYGGAASSTTSIMDKIELFKMEHHALTDVPVLLLSTSDMYSDRDVDLARRPMEPMSEDEGLVFHSVLAPNASKILYTLLVENAFMVRSTRTMCLRVFNVYGPSIKKGLVHEFVTKAKRGEKLPIYGSPFQTRSFLFEDDFFDCIEKCMYKLHKGSKGLFNVGSDVPVSFSELVTHVEHFAGKNLCTEVRPHKDFSLWKLPDITRIRAVADWTPKVSIRGGLKILL